MKIMLQLRTICMVFVVFSAVLVEARTGYVHDEVEITLRSGESTKNSIVRMLSSGERLDVISVNDATGYAKVMTENGKEGFVLARFVTYEPIARDKLVTANRRLEQNKQKIERLEAELSDLKSQNTSYTSSQSQLESDNARLSDELAQIRRTAASALQLADENKSLTSRENNLETQLRDLGARNQVLAARSRQSWYLAGAGTLIAGILAGLILPRLKFKRRSRWGDL